MAKPAPVLRPMASADTARAAILAKLQEIPAGTVASYGLIARLAGYPRHARWVGRLLREADDTLALPWHRVVNAQGESALDGPGRTEQWRRLRAEGVAIVQDRVDLSRYSWHPGRGTSPLLD